jgi:hydrogenase maturation factor
VSEGTFCSCTTCRDEAIEMRIVVLGESGGLAQCESADGSRRMVDVTLVEDAVQGEAILVHADVAIARAPSPGVAA